MARAIVRAASRGSPSSAMSTSSVGAAEQPVAHGAADEPRLAARERLAGGLERLASPRCSRGTRGEMPQVIS